MNLSTKQKQTRRHSEQINRPVVVQEERGMGRLSWTFEISRCKLSYIEWINSRSYCIAQGLYAIYSVISHNEKNMKKNIKTNRFAVYQKLTL